LRLLELVRLTGGTLRTVATDVPRMKHANGAAFARIRPISRGFPTSVPELLATLTQPLFMR